MTLAELKKHDTWEKLCKNAKVDPKKIIPDTSTWPERMQKAALGVFKIFMIVEWANGNWEADYANGNQRKYDPWMYYDEVAGAFRFGGSHFDFSDALSLGGARLVTDSAEKAAWICSTFIELFNDVNLKR